MALTCMCGASLAQSGKAAQNHADVDYDPEAFVRARILALIEYLSRLQER